MRNRHINAARNVWDRAVTLMPRIEQFWFKYVYMEEMVGNLSGARVIFDRWMDWEPDDHAWTSYGPQQQQQQPQPAPLWTPLSAPLDTLCVPLSKPPAHHSAHHSALYPSPPPPPPPPSPPPSTLPPQSASRCASTSPRAHARSSSATCSATTTRRRGASGPSSRRSRARRRRRARSSSARSRHVRVSCRRTLSDSLALPLIPLTRPPSDARPSSPQELEERDHTQELFLTFGQFEERAKESDRARVIYKFGLDTLPRSQAQELYKKYVQFEKQHGDRKGIDDVISSKKRFQYEEQVPRSPPTHPEDK